MALRVFQFACTIPAGTAQASPATIPLAIDGWDLSQIDLEVPPGPSGEMGFYVANNDVQWIPFTPGAWLVWDDVIQSWPFTDQPNASGWAIVGYNTGTFDHTVTVRMHVDPATPDVTTAAVPAVTIVTTAAPTTDPVTL